MARRALPALILCVTLCSTLPAQTTARYSFVDLSSVYAELPRVSELKIASSDGLFPVGWSVDGKFAYVTQVSSPFRPDVVCRLVIQDMVTDKVVWDTGSRSMMDLVESGKTLPKLNGEPLSTGYFFTYYYDELSAALARFKIVSVSKADLFQFPCAMNGYTLDASVIVLSKSTAEGFEGTPVYGSFAYDLFMKHSVLGKKKIFSEKLSDTYLLSVDPVGFFVSPYEKRAAVVVAYYKWGLELEHSATYRVVGSLYESGFAR
jgi:hypothetical protein